MTVYEFKSLNEHEQAEAIWEHGTHIASRDENEHRILLYQIDGFYAEVYYNDNDNKIDKLRSFSSITQLEPYLSQLKITL